MSKFIVPLEGIAKSLEEAWANTEERLQRYREVTAELPDGTNVAGWVKTTIAGDVFWIKPASSRKRERQTFDLLEEVGQVAVDRALAGEEPSTSARRASRQASRRR